jgi:cell division protein FtsI/penicillin-binding protein 2
MKNWRINLIFFILILVGVVIVNRLVYFQIKNHDLYKALAQGQQRNFKMLDEQRGNILLSTGQLLATNTKNEAGEIIRSHPQGSMASNIVGFIGGEGTGQYGIEGYYEDELSGGENKGDDIYLTLDYNVQFIAEGLLKKASESLKIESGQIIVIDPTTGKILALADYPGFDPSKYFEVKDFSIFQNGAVQKLFEPGSTLKPVTMAAALDKNKITPETTFVDSGGVQVDDVLIENFGKKSYGKCTMTEVLEKSVNTGVVFAERQMGHEIFLSYLEGFGFFEPTGIDVLGEAYSENKQFKKGGDVNYATASFGQGIEITPMQLVRAFSAIANGGNLVKPYIVNKIIDNGKTIQTKPEVSSRQVISADTASKVSAMMVSVVENGYSKTAGIKGYYIAGKTGTAQVPWSALEINKKGYSDRTWQSFLGFFPAFNPRFLVLVKLDNPKASTAEYSAAPIFKEMSKYLINYYSVPPDYE